MKEKYARVAQSVERVAFNHNVQGSSPCSGGCFFYHKKIYKLQEHSKVDSSVGRMLD